MEKYTYEVRLTVEVEAFEEADAWSLIQDTFGIGEDLGVAVTSCEYRGQGR